MELPTAEALERVLVDAVAREPDSELIDEPTWVQVRTPSSPRPNHNVVLMARLRPDEVAAKVAEVAAEHQSRGARYRWVVGPSSSPAELGAHVEASGLRRLGNSLGMAMPVPSADRPLGVEGLTVHEVGPDDVDAYAALTARAWERPDFEEAVAYITRKSFGFDSGARSYLARLDGVEVASSYLRLLPGLGYFQGGAVLPQYRHRGIYRALLHHRLAVLRARGIPMAVVWAAAASSGIVCDSVGFTRICSAVFYE